MVEIKQADQVSIIENEWESLDTFFTDFAKSNEGMSIEDNAHNDSQKVETAKESSREHGKTVSGISRKIPIDNSRIAEVSKKLIAENSGNFANKYTGLHTDIKNILLELQEIKKARLDLQTRLDSIR